MQEKHNGTISKGETGRKVIPPPQKKHAISPMTCSESTLWFMKEIFFVFVGGGTGSTLRYLASMLWQHLSLHPRFQDTVMPWSTLVVNVIGCALISVFYNYSERLGLTYETRLLLTTGLCGGFTTFSTFSYEALALLRNGHTGTFVMYILLSVCLGLAAAALPFVMKE